MAALPTVTWSQIRAHTLQYTILSTSIKELEEFKAKIDEATEQVKDVDDNIDNCQRTIATCKAEITNLEDKKKKAIDRGGSTSRLKKYDDKLESTRKDLVAQEAVLKSLIGKKGEISSYIEKSNGKFDADKLVEKHDQRRHYKDRLLWCLEHYNSAKGHIRMMTAIDLKALQFLHEVDENKVLRFAVGKSVDQIGKEPLDTLAEDMGIQSLDSGTLYEIKGNAIRAIPDDEAKSKYKFFREAPGVDKEDDKEA